MHKTLILLSLLAISGLTKLTQYQELSPLWSSWKTIHQKEYSAAEDDVRYAIFVDNYHKITKHNAEHSNPRLGLTKFADLTFEEFGNLYSECSHTTRPNSDDRQTIPYELIKAPDSVDWRNGNYVTPVKDQGQCGSCWTFAATGALEGFYAIHQGQLLSFSEQQLVDCSTDAPNSGCNGGNAGVAIDYAAQNGMAQEDQYPYTAQDGYCSYQGGGVRVNSGAADVTHNSVDALKSAIATQPTTVAVEVNDMFQHYTGGIIDGNSGCGANTNHAVLAVGYGRIDGQNEAFIIKNSWGEGWGDRGYVYLSTDGGANGGAGVCGVLTYPVVVT